MWFVEKNTLRTYMRIGGGEGGGGFTPPLGSRKMLLVGDFWKINKKFWCKSFVLDINFKKFSVQMRMG